MYPLFARKPLAGLLSLGLVTVAGTVQASGFRIPEVTNAGLGTSNALVANHKEVGALPYNPAAMAFHEGANLTAGLIIIDPEAKYTDPNGKTTKSNPSTPFYVPNAYIMDHINDDLTWGFGVTAPFGLQTKWAPGTFFGFAETAAAAAAAGVPPQVAAQIAGAHPTFSKVEMLNFNPNIAYKIGDNLSVAAGIDYYFVNGLNLDTTGADIYGDGDGWGYNVGALYIAGAWSFGGSYRSDVSADIEGSVDTVLGSTAAETTMEFPWMAQIGIRYQVTDAFAVEFDLERTGWSSFDQITIDMDNGGTLVSSNNWDDVNAYRLGGTYDIRSGTQLRFGYTRDETEQPDDSFSPRVPDNGRQLVSFGVAQDMDGWAIEASYMYSKLNDRTVDQPAWNPLTDPDPNGTGVYNGEYETDIHLLGLGITATF